MKLYSYLYSQKKYSKFKKSDDYAFFNQYKYILEENILFAKYLDIDNIFDLMKANIIIKSMINKYRLDEIFEEEFINRNFNTEEEIYSNIKEKSVELPCFISDNQKIFIPFFNRSTNLVYSSNFDLMNKEPYLNLKRRFDPFVVDPFETYKIEVFDSVFTKFVKVMEHANSTVFYHYDLDIIFVINNQGYLDSYITLFDRHMKNVNKDHLIDRIRHSMDYYFENNLVGFLYSLYENNLISQYCFRRLCKWKNI